jgi:hypothetical protein
MLSVTKYGDKTVYIMVNHCPLNLDIDQILYFLVKFRFFIQELWERKSLQILYEC